jgi:hypothetical protein
MTTASRFAEMAGLQLNEGLMGVEKFRTKSDPDRCKILWQYAKMENATMDLKEWKKYLSAHCEESASAPKAE